MRFPEELLLNILQELRLSRDSKALASFARCSRLANVLATPLLYQRLTLHDEQAYSHLIELFKHYHESQVGSDCASWKKSPLQYVKHLEIEHFPNTFPHIDNVLLPNVSSVHFTLASCHSILWGPMQAMRSGRQEEIDLHIKAFARISSPKRLCLHLSHYTVFDRDWDVLWAKLGEAWKASIEEVSVHGLEYWLKALVPGVVHRVYLEVDNVVYRPGTGLLVSKNSAVEREQCIEAWSTVLLAMLVDGLRRDKVAKAKTRWELHCPDARVDEIRESEEALFAKLEQTCSDYEAPQGVNAQSDLIRFMTGQPEACSVCGGECEMQPKLMAECAPRTVHPDRSRGRERVLAAARGCFR